MAAFVGEWFVTRQTRQADKHERERRDRRRLALRAVLPLSLTALTGYARNSGDALRRYYEAAKNGTLGQLRPEPVPQLPTDAINVLRDFAEYASRSEAIFIAQMLSEVQVQRARLRDLDNALVRGDAEEIITSPNIEEYIIDSASIYAFAAGLYDFARFQSEEFPKPPEAPELIRALANMRFWDARYPEIHATVVRRGGVVRFKDKPRELRDPA